MSGSVGNEERWAVTDGEGSATKETLLLQAKMATLEAEVVRLSSVISGTGERLLATETTETETTRGTQDQGLSTKVLLDPLTALEIRTLRKLLHDSKTQYKTLKEDTQVMTSFTTEGPLGRRLLDRCRKLLTENQQLGEAIVTSKIADADAGAIFQTEKEQFLVNQLKLVNRGSIDSFLHNGFRLLYEFNADLENECAALIKSVNRLALANQTLKTECERMETQNAELHRRLERMDNAAATRSPSRTTTERRNTHRGSSPPARRSGRERSPSFDRHSRGPENRRMGRRE